MSIYFYFITCILLITLVIFLIHFIRIRLVRDENVFRKKLGKPLNDEQLLETGDLNRSALDRLYVNVSTINELVDSKELELFLNPFHIDIIHEEYELMRLKYKAIRNRIEDKILQKDGHYQTNRRSITQVYFNDSRLPRASPQRDVLLNSQFDQQIGSHLHHHQTDSGSKRVRFRDLHNDSSDKRISRRTNRTIGFTDYQSSFAAGFMGTFQSDTYPSSNFPRFTKKASPKEQSGFSKFLPKFVDNAVTDISMNAPVRNWSGGHSFYWKRLRQRLEAEQKNRQIHQLTGLKPFDSNYIFKYSLPNSLDLVNKYSKKSSFD